MKLPDLNPSSYAEALRNKEDIECLRVHSHKENFRAGLFTSRGCRSGEEAAHEAVVNYREPTQPNPGCNEADAARSSRPKGKKCRLLIKAIVIMEISE